MNDGSLYLKYNPCFSLTVTDYDLESDMTESIYLGKSYGDRNTAITEAPRGTSKRQTQVGE